MAHKILCTTVLTGLIALAASTANAQISFEPFAQYAAGDRPGAITTGDFNGDNILDLATANFNGDDVSIFPGVGDGTFAPTVNFAVGESPASVTRCALNGDGASDLVVANYGFGFNRISVLLNETENADAPQFSHSFYESASRPTDIACADLDGDGDQDLAVANQDSDDVFLFENNGEGLFNMRGSLAAERWPWAIEAADLDGDGLLDLAVANNESNTVSILIKNPGALADFQPQVSVSVGSRPDGLAIFDLDGDGSQDLVTPNRGTSDVTVLRNDGSGTNYDRSDYDGDGGLLAVAVGDVSQDGRPDIVTANNSQSQATILPNNFLRPGTLLPFVSFPVASDPRGITLGDFNADGWLDVAAANTNSRLVSILLNTTRRPPGGISCAALVTETTNLTAGVDDTFLPPTEPATPGADLLPLCSNSKDFDASSTDDCFGHTFTGLPANIVSATLAVRMRANSTASTNDSIQLGLHDGSFLWGRRIGTGGPFSGDVPGLSPDPWSLGTTQTFQLDLGALPDRQGTLTSILDVLNSSHTLDVRVTDDTGVDFLSLQVKHCHSLFYGGFDHAPVKHSGLIANTLTNELLVEISGEEGGVDIDTGSAEGVCVQMACPLGSDRGTALEISASGTVLQEPRVLGTLTIENSHPTGTFVTNFPDSDTTPIVVQVCDDKARVASEFIIGNGPIAMIPIDTCITEVDYFSINPESSGFRVLLDGLTEVTLPNGDTVMGDSIKIYPDFPTPIKTRLEKFSITRVGAPSLTLIGEALQQFGEFQSALGQAILQPSEDQLTLSNLGTSGDDGLTVHLDRAKTFHMEWLDLDPASSLPTGAGMEFRSTGTLTGGGSEQDLGTLSLAKTQDDLEVTADFTAIESPTQRLEIYRDGQLIETMPGNSESVSISALENAFPWPIAADKIGGTGRPTCYVLKWPQDVLFGTFTKELIVGDELRILAENQDERLAHLDSFTVQTMAIPELTILDEGPSSLDLPCEEATQLCLREYRFQVEVQWRDFQGRTGSGRAVPLAQESGYFWFFRPGNAEIAIKVLDGRPLNGHWWVFYGALSNVEYTVTVTDTQTDAVATYFNPSGRFFSVADTRALGDGPSAALRSVLVGSDDLPGLTVATGAESAANSVSVIAGKQPCASTNEALCLNGDRFLVEVEWEDFQGNTGTETAVPLTSDTGYFWFYEPGNVELIVKMLDGRSLNGHWWFFYASLSNVAYTITVTDTQTNTVRTYVNPLGELQSRGDTRAFQEP